MTEPSKQPRRALNGIFTVLATLAAIATIMQLFASYRGQPRLEVQRLHESTVIDSKAVGGMPLQVIWRDPLEEKPVKDVRVALFRVKNSGSEPLQWSEDVVEPTQVTVKGGRVLHVSAPNTQRSSDFAVQLKCDSGSIQFQTAALNPGEWFDIVVVHENASDWSVRGKILNHAPLALGVADAIPSFSRRQPVQATGTVYMLVGLLLTMVYALGYSRDEPRNAWPSWASIRTGFQCGFLPAVIVAVPVYVANAIWRNDSISFAANILILQTVVTFFASGFVAWKLIPDGATAIRRIFRDSPRE